MENILLVMMILFSLASQTNCYNDVDQRLKSQFTQELMKDIALEAIQMEDSEFFDHRRTAFGEEDLFKRLKEKEFEKREEEDLAKLVNSLSENSKKSEIHSNTEEGVVSQTNQKRSNGVHSELINNESFNSPEIQDSLLEDTKRVMNYEKRNSKMAKEPMTVEICTQSVFLKLTRALCKDKTKWRRRRSSMEGEFIGHWSNAKYLKI